jgi:PIN domain nuclease of toxin-antitoxin system
MEEPGAEAIDAALLAGALISSVNWSETLAKLLEIGIPLGEAKDALDRLQLRFIPFERSHAETCAVLREPTRSAGLSLADRACLATALVERLVVLTADRAWGTLDLSLDIRCIR